MKRERSFILLITLALLLSTSSNGHQNGAQKHSKHVKQKDHNSNSTHYDIRSFGAVGDGVSDDSEALKEAWKAACKVDGATVEIPSGLNFLLRPVTLQGPCMPHLTLQSNRSVNITKAAAYILLFAGKIVFVSIALV